MSINSTKRILIYDKEGNLIGSDPIEIIEP